MGKVLNKTFVLRGRKRDGLTLDTLLQKLEDQNFLCALSGVPLTCTLEKGIVHKTNATVDRIVAGGSYTPDNIQLVCRAVNSFRNNTSVEEYIEWCRIVTEYHNGRKT